MILIICSVRDSKSSVFGRPFFAPTIGAAIRSFDDETNSAAPDNILYRHPEDFQLFQLGTFDDNSGEMKSITPKLLVDGNAVFKHRKNEGGDNVSK